jgi:hypothetical protein
LKLHEAHVDGTKTSREESMPSCSSEAPPDLPTVTATTEPVTAEAFSNCDRTILKISNSFRIGAATITGATVNEA